jgi:NTP pyrophosphatase (non-canonical NTP hydrolase)
MGYPSDDMFEQARQHRAPPSRIEETGLQDDDGEPLVKVRSLSFAELRAANRARLPQFKNARGEPAHSQPDGSDWSDSDWLMAVTGELGEFANLRKKLLRGDMTREQAMPMLADELADVATYLDILAFRLGIDLGAAIVDKFNRVSERVGADVRL